MNSRPRGYGGRSAAPRSGYGRSTAFSRSPYGGGAPRQSYNRPVRSAYYRPRRFYMGGRRYN